MRPTFSGINIARSALVAQQLALDTIGQNVANANTPGYSRRRVSMNPYLPIPGKDYGAGAGQVGTGVQADLIERLRNQFLDRQYRDENGLKGQYETSYDYLQRVEAVFGELDGEGLAPLMDKFFNSWHELSIRPDNISIRKTVAEAGYNLGQFFNKLISDLQGIQSDLNDDLNNTVTVINQKAQRLAALNKQIKISLASGDQPNDLMDERDRILDDLSKISDIKIADPANDHFKVIINGKPIVEGDTFHPLQTIYNSDALIGTTAIDTTGITMQRTSTGVAGQGFLKINGVAIYDEGTPANNVINSTAALVNLINSKSGQTGVLAKTDESNRLYLYANGMGTQSINIEEDGNGFAVTKISNGIYQQTNANKIRYEDLSYVYPDNGKLKGIDDTIFSTIPDLIKKLDTLASSLITRVNTVHQNSYDLNGNTGIPFFTGTKASDIAVSGTIMADPSTIAIAASSIYPPGDGSNALQIANLKSATVVNGLTVDNYYNSLLTDLGMVVERTGTLSDSQGLILDQIQTQKESVSGVNMDEEMADLVQYQRSYAAAARVMNAMDEVLNTVINGMGLVGR